MDDKKLKYLLALKSIPGLGNVVLSVLLEKFPALEEIFSASAGELIAASGMAKKAASALAGFKDWDLIEKNLELLEKSGIHIITFQDDLYPAKLLEIYDRPVLLYVCGNLKKDAVNVAIVGSRLASTYGKYTTERISRELALQGVTVVSGLARGIDSAAHRGALLAHGQTIAVLGSGPDIIYPPENKKLFADIAREGAIVSEFPLGTPPRAANFPARNRIISGMSYGVVVVEAGEKSGSLITARLALEQGREVFAVPGSIDAAGSRGTNKLIKQGAKLIENTGDILEEILPQLEKRKITETLSLPRMQSVPKLKIENLTENLSESDKKIVSLLSRATLHAEELMAATGLTPHDLLSALLTMELKGIIKQHPGKFFSLNK